MFAALLAAALVTAAPSDSAPAPVEPARAFTFGPDRPERSAWFLVTEFDASVTSLDTYDAFDRMLFTDALGLMRSVGRANAVGASIDADLARGGVRLVPTLRYKRWLAGRTSVDVLLGYAASNLETAGVNGPVFDVRYSPAPWCHVQVGACRVRQVTSIWYVPYTRVFGTNPVVYHAGIGLGGAPGAIAWGAQALGFAGLLYLFRNMD